jgi:hypothetical protein
MPDDFCRLVAIYGLIDPRTGCIRYVGKSLNLAQRYNHHVNYQDGSSHKSCWIKGLKRLGLAPELVPLQFVSEASWEATEKWWIAHFRDHGADLTNGTAGGDGMHDPPPEVRAKLSAARKGKPRPPGVMAKMRAARKRTPMKPHSEETKARMAESHKALPSEHWDYLRGRTLTAEHRAKIATGCTGKTRNQYPPDDELERMLKGHSLASVARSLGLNNTALHYHVKKMRARREAAPPE